MCTKLAQLRNRKNYLTLIQQPCIQSFSAKYKLIIIKNHKSVHLNIFIAIAFDFD